MERILKKEEYKRVLNPFLPTRDDLYAPGDDPFKREEVLQGYSEGEKRNGGRTTFPWSLLDDVSSAANLPEAPLWKFNALFRFAKSMQKLGECGLSFVARECRELAASADEWA